MISDDESDHETDQMRREVRCLSEDVATSGGGGSYDYYIISVPINNRVNYNDVQSMLVRRLLMYSLHW